MQREAVKGHASGPGRPMEYPFPRQRDRGNGTGRAEIVYSEEQGWEEAQHFAARAAVRLGLAGIRRVDGPDAWC